MKALWEYKDLVGEKVIVRSNEDEPYYAGTFVRFNEHGLPVVQFDKDGIEYTCGGCVMPYTLKMIETLDGMTPKEQYDYCRYFTLFISLLSSAHRNPRRIG
jgi:hypothetical protein